MHQRSIEAHQQNHDFLANNQQGRRRIGYVLWLTFIMMLAEIIAGTVFGSMALLADGWHMATHVAAFLITLFAYRYANKHADNPNFSFGTGKVTVLGGFSSAIALAVVALMMGLESIERLFSPVAIQINAAIAVAILGLVVNLVSAFLLKDHHAHGHEHSHDHNLKAAYLHVLADALTSILAIAALLAAKWFGVVWLDPLIGILGAVIISVWALGLLRDTSPILLDGSIDADYQQAIQQQIEQDRDNRIADFHIWHVSAHHYAAIMTIVTHHPQPAEYYHRLLASFERLSHITIEVRKCEDAGCSPDNSAG